MVEKTIKNSRVPLAYQVSSDSGRAPGREHQVWYNYRAPDGSSRGKRVAVSGDRAHAERIAANLNDRLNQRLSNWPAVIAAIGARGPRCEFCGSWTFRPQLLSLPAVIRACPDCLPGPAFRNLTGC
jgi:hypothetical protein